MKLKFENQQYQLDAINSTIKLFQGMEILNHTQILSNQKELLNLDIVGNGLQIDQDRLLTNLQNIQLANGISEYNDTLYYGDYKYTHEDGRNIQIPNFSIEMETGTGKTYVYLRTIFELNRHYGLTKFIIVVPSNAIKVGTLKSLEITQDHFKAEYNNINYDYYLYDSDHIYKVRDFATNNNIQIMIMTSAAFNKKSNLIHQFTDKFGEYKPIDMINVVKPIIILDEPQSLDSGRDSKTKDALKDINALFMLRYSATHKEVYNLIYKLDAVDAFQQKLVKQIEVASIEDSNFIEDREIPYLKVVDIPTNLKHIKLELDCINKKGKLERKTQNITNKSDIAILTNNPQYDGYIVENYSRDYGLTLSNLDHDIAIGEAIGNTVDETLKVRIMLRMTIENHIKKELKFNNTQSIKILSLFFIENVADYRLHESDSSTNGYLANMFIEEFKNILQTTDGQRYSKYCQDKFSLDLTNEEDLNRLHDGYFAKDTKGNYKNSKENTDDAASTYDLIMKDKEKLLDSNTPLRFIFSHSALKEGWDNPNVFQVCVLTDSSNSFKRRQQIGRGLRLAVNANGDRIKDTNVNLLTVIAKESYSRFAKELQTEYEKDNNIKFGHIHSLVFVRQLQLTNPDNNLQSNKRLSESIYNELKTKNYLDNDDKLTTHALQLIKTNLFKIDNIELKPYEDTIINVLSRMSSKLPIPNQKNKKEININRDVYNNLEFKQLWDKIKHKTIYSITINSDELIIECINHINNQELNVSANQLVINRVQLNIEDSGINTKLMSSNNETINSHDTKIDIIGRLMTQTNLTRKSIINILKGINKDKLELHKTNTEKFVTEIANIINNIKNKLFIDGIKYTKLEDLDLKDNYYKQEQLARTIEYGYRDELNTTNLADANDLGVNTNLFKEKFLYDLLRYDSQVEFDFLKDCLTKNQVKLITKLPSWFTINTPLGKYNPDWALLIRREQQDEEVYFIAETKSLNFNVNGRDIEKAKVKCGKLHFVNALDIQYKVVGHANEIL